MVRCEEVDEFFDRAREVELLVARAWGDDEPPEVPPEYLDVRNQWGPMLVELRLFGNKRFDEVDLEKLIYHDEDILDSDDQHCYHIATHFWGYLTRWRMTDLANSAAGGALMMIRYDTAQKRAQRSRLFTRLKGNAIYEFSRLVADEFSSAPKAGVMYRAEEIVLRAENAMKLWSAYART